MQHQSNMTQEVFVQGLQRPGDCNQMSYNKTPITIQSAANNDIQDGLMQRVADIKCVNNPSPTQLKAVVSEGPATPFSTTTVFSMPTTTVLTTTSVTMFTTIMHTDATQSTTTTAATTAAHETDCQENKRKNSGNDEGNATKKQNVATSKSQTESPEDQAIMERLLKEIVGVRSSIEMVNSKVSDC